MTEHDFFSFCLPLAILRSLNLFNRPLRNDWQLSGMIKRILLYCNFSCNSWFFPSWFLEHCISTVRHSSSAGLSPKLNRAERLFHVFFQAWLLAQSLSILVWYFRFYRTDGMFSLWPEWSQLQLPTGTTA